MDSIVMNTSPATPLAIPTANASTCSVTFPPDIDVAGSRPSVIDQVSGSEEIFVGVTLPAIGGALTGSMRGVAKDMSPVKESGAAKDMPPVGVTGGWKELKAVEEPMRCSVWLVV